MKKAFQDFHFIFKIVFICIGYFVCIVPFKSYAQNTIPDIKESPKRQNASLYITAGFIPIHTKDFMNFDVSDWERYGLRMIDPSSKEGRVRIPLGDNDPNGLMTNINIGMNIPHKSNKFDLLIDLDGAFASHFSLFGISAGGGLHVVDIEKFRLSVVSKLTYMGGSVDFGSVKLINNYVAPVIISQGRFTNGDTLKCKMSGVGFQIGLRPMFIMSKKTSLILDGGYTIGLMGNTKIQVNSNYSGNININMNDPALVKTDGYNSQAGLTPTLKIQGIYFQAGVQLKFYQ